MSESFQRPEGRLWVKRVVRCETCDEQVAEGPSVDPVAAKPSLPVMNDAVDSIEQHRAATGHYTYRLDTLFGPVVS